MNKGSGLSGIKKPGRIFIIFLLLLILAGCSREGKQTEDPETTGTPAPTLASSEEPQETVTPEPTVGPQEEVKRGFLMTTMPVVTIDTGHELVSENDDYTRASLALYSPETDREVLTAEAGIRIRGNASRGFTKRSYRIKLDEKSNLYGIGNGKEKVWVLSSNHCDQSLLRNYAAFTLAGGFDAIAWEPKGINVELYLNGRYEGVYFLCEHIRVSKDRVNIEKNKPDEIDTGYLLQYSRYAEDDIFTYGDSKFEISSDLSSNPDIKAEQIRFISDYVTKCYDALKTGDEELIRSLVDVESLVASYIVEETVRNIDAQWDSFYLYKDRGGKLVFGPLWDFDLCFGNDYRAETDKYDSYKELYVGYGLGSTNGSADNSVFKIMLQHEWFRKLVREEWNREYERIAKLSEEVQNYAEPQLDAYIRNFRRWQIYGRRINMEPDEIRNFRNYNDQINYLANWIDNRVAWLNAAFNSSDFIENLYVDKEIYIGEVYKGNPEVSDTREEYESFPAFNEYKTGNLTAGELIKTNTDMSGTLVYGTLFATLADEGSGAANLFDGLSDTKYSAYNEDGIYTISFKTRTRQYMHGYIIYTTDDFKEHYEYGPDSWKVYGSNDNKKWTEISYVGTGTVIGKENSAGYGFVCGNPGEYQYYKFIFKNDDRLEIAEINMFKW